MFSRDKFPDRLSIQYQVGSLTSSTYKQHEMNLVGFVCAHTYVSTSMCACETRSQPQVSLPEALFPWFSIQGQELTD